MTVYWVELFFDYGHEWPVENVCLLFLTTLSFVWIVTHHTCTFPWYFMALTQNPISETWSRIDLSLPCPLLLSVDLIIHVYALLMVVFLMLCLTELDVIHSHQTGVAFWPFSGLQPTQPDLVWLGIFADEGFAKVLLHRGVQILLCAYLAALSI